MNSTEIEESKQENFFGVTNNKLLTFNECNNPFTNGKIEKLDF